MGNIQDKDGVVPSKQRLYQMTAAHAKEALAVLVEAMRNGDNTNAKVGAAKTILAKCIPDLKATELTGEDGKELIIRFLDYGINHNPSRKTETSIENE